MTDRTEHNLTALEERIIFSALAAELVRIERDLHATRTADRPIRRALFRERDTVLKLMARFGG